MKTGHKIVIYSFIIILLLYSFIITGYILKNAKSQYYANKDTQQEIYNINARMDNISNQQNAQYRETANLKISLEELKTKINNIAPQSDKISYSQVSTIINTANQSLLLQDTNTTLSLLKYAVDFIDTLHQPMFANLTVSIQEDITYLQSNKDYDTNFVLVKIDALNQSIDNIFSNRLMQLKHVNNQSMNNLWHKFVSNAKNTLFHFWENNIKTSNADDILYSKLQLDIMNLKHALIIHDQTLWSNSLNSIKNESKNASISENEYNLLLPYLNLLENINVAREKNLSHTMNAMNDLSNYVLNRNINV
jgi:uncharacterized protein HemX